jgi:iron complex transport system ATP-binding protein
MKLVAEGLTVHHPGVRTPAVAGVSVALHPGEIVAVVGPNGSGKSTLLRALLGLLAPAAGSVHLDGRPITAWSRRELADAVGALPQREDQSVPLTVAETVLLGRWSRLGPVAPVGSADRSAVAAALRRCDVVALADRRIDTLSGGEWQRVRVARALAASPRLLLLDEPTAALDVGHEMELFELLRRLVAEGLGVLVITHQLNLAARFADRLVLLDRGRTVAEGRPHHVLREDVVSAVFGWPVAVTTWCDGAPQVIPLRRAEAAESGRAAPPPPEDQRP